MYIDSVSPGFQAFCNACFTDSCHQDHILKTSALCVAVILAKFGMDGKRDTRPLENNYLKDHDTKDGDIFDDPRLDKLWNKVCVYSNNDVNICKSKALNTLVSYIFFDIWVKLVISSYRMSVYGWNIFQTAKLPTALSESKIFTDLLPIIFCRRKETGFFGTSRM